MDHVTLDVTDVFPWDKPRYLKSVYGTERTVQLDGRGFTARIPKGATDGQRLRLRGKGGPGAAHLWLEGKLSIGAFDELTLDEIAAILDLPPGTVKSRLAYGLSTLRRLLADAASAA